MSIKIVEGVISPEDCQRYSDFLDANSYQSPRPSIVNALGYSSSLQASKTNGETGVIHGDDSEVNKELGQVFEDVKKIGEEFFGRELDLCQSNYQLLLPGADNGVHADAIELDGTPIQPDGTPDEIEWSGLLYLNSYEESFTGGVLYFPGLEIEYRPRAGDVVVFRGDIEHRHGVTEVLSGERRNIVFFWSNKGNVSERSFFDSEYKVDSY
jgi:hypothetical protein